MCQHFVVLAVPTGASAGEEQSKIFGHTTVYTIIILLARSCSFDSHRLVKRRKHKINILDNFGIKFLVSRHTFSMCKL